MQTKTRADRAELRERNEVRCRRLLTKSELVEVDDLAWDDVGSVELAPADIDTLVYMRDVEGYTDSYLVGVGAHPTTLADPLVRDFLDVWQAEEAAHAAALARFLDAYADQRGIVIPLQAAAPAPDVPAHERVLTRVGGPIGATVTAAHMAWGAANELLTMHGYRLLSRRCGHPMLADLLDRIAAQEARHYSFYLLQAEWRLASSRMARAVLPRLLRSSWTPVGVGDGYKTATEFERVLIHLCAVPESRRILDRMDRRMAALPGFEQLRIFSQAAAALPA